MGMPTAEILALYKRSLLDAAAVFTAPDDADFLRHLRIAAREIAVCKRTRTAYGTLSLVPGQDLYPAPENLLLPKVSAWGVTNSLAPWDLPRGPLPALSLVEDGPEGRALRLSPAPSAHQVRVFGAEYPYYYLSAHELPDTGPSTITQRELNLLILRAQVEALREMTVRNHNKPVNLRQGEGLSGVARNMTPAALYAAFLNEYQEAA